MNFTACFRIYMRLVGKPVFLTKNGRGKFVVMEMDCYGKTIVFFDIEVGVDDKKIHDMNISNSRAKW